MNLTKTPFTNAAIGNDPEILRDIHLQPVNIAIYEREILPTQTELDHILEQSIECRASGSIAEVTATLRTYFAETIPEQQALLDDILEVLQLFEKSTEISSFRLLLATVSTNMCRRFHTDINDLRLLCTYAGPGTLWLPNEAVNQKAYQGGRSNMDIVANEGLIQQAQTGDVVILKGALYPDANPVLHRSPSIEQTQGKRLLLRIDNNESHNLWS